MTDNDPHLREQHATDKYGTKLVNKAGSLQEKAQDLVGKSDSEKKQPAGGYDATTISRVPPGYTVRITFHRAENLPMTDFPSFSTDAYIHATFKTNLPKRHKQDPDIFLRTPTIHRNTNPRWETQWVLAHVPASGFFMKCRLYDEDPSDHDDRLGNVHVNVEGISEGWQGLKEQPFNLKKRMGSKRAYTFRGAAHLFAKVKMSARLYISVEVLGRSPGESGGRCFTVAPLPWSRHHSPLIGRIAGTKDREESKNGKKSVERYNFQAIQMQLRGPVPAEMYHRYVEFRPFIAGMFTDVTLRGRILNRALHHQHARIYNYDRSTVYGIFERPCIEMTKQLLEFCHYDQGGRIYTYVLSLDGLWRFTETGKEFGIDMLSKHTMHSDVSIYIAFSGEFFIRRLKHPHREQHQSEDVGSANQHDPVGDVAPPASDHENGEQRDQHAHENISKDPSDYELIIDNDSGTYRPNADLLPLLKEYMSQNFPGLRVATLDCQKDEEKMKKLKKEQVDRKKNSGKQITYLQNSSMSSLSSSDAEELDARAEGHERPHGYKKKMAKMQGYRRDKNSDPAKSAAPNDGHGHSKGVSSAEKDLPSEHDSRDFSSSVSAASSGATQQSQKQQEEGVDNDQKREDGGYANKELPTLLKRDANGHIPRPQESESDDRKLRPDSENDQHRLDLSDGGSYKPPSGNAYGEPETGEHRPAGGIIYGKIFNTAGVEKGRLLGIGDMCQDGAKKEVQ